MKQHMILALALAVAAGACNDDPARPRPDAESPALELTPRINVQLGDTPAGQQPQYIVTGNVTATQGATVVASRIDSIRMAYRVDNSAWTSIGAPSQFPFSGHLPFTAKAGESYALRAALYATASSASGERKSAADEWTAEGKGY